MTIQCLCRMPTVQLAGLACCSNRTKNKYQKLRCNLMARGPRATVSPIDEKEIVSSDTAHTTVETEFLLVRDQPLQLWANGRHFIEDSDGSIEEGQFVCMIGPVVTVWRIIDPGRSDVRDDEQTVTLRHRFTWSNGEIDQSEYTEPMNRSELTGDYDQAMGDVSEMHFLRRFSNASHD